MYYNKLNHLFFCSISYLTYNILWTSLLNYFDTNICVFMKNV